jgi:hypothetical protein
MHPLDAVFCSNCGNRYYDRTNAKKMVWLNVMLVLVPAIFFFFLWAIMIAAQR